MATGKRLARDQANEKIAQLIELDGDKLAHALAEASQWLDGLPRSRREAAMDVFLNQEGKVVSLLTGMLLHSMERHNADLVHLTNAGEEANWPRLAADGGLHETWYCLCVKNGKMNLDGAQVEKLREVLASSIELASGLLVRGQVSAKNLGVTETELGELWTWTARQWNDKHPMVLVAPVRCMGRAYKTLVELGALEDCQLLGLDKQFLEVVGQVAGLMLKVKENSESPPLRTRLNASFGQQEQIDPPDLGGPRTRL